MTFHFNKIIGLEELEKAWEYEMLIINFRKKSEINKNVEFRDIRSQD